MEQNINSQHHVAWADRLGLNKIWHEAIQGCSMAYGTEEYRRQVFRLYHLLVDIKDGPKLKSLTTTYKNTVWEKKILDRLERWRMENPDLRDEIPIIQDEMEKIRDDMMEDLFDYMLQLLETQGYGFYKSDITIDDISLTSKGTYSTEDDNIEQF